MRVSHIFDTSAKKEYWVLALCVALLLVLVFPSLLHARREYRDGLQREQVFQLKRKLEDIYNKKGQYPLEFYAAPYEYHVTKSDGKSALEWYVRGALENSHETSTAYDAEEGHNFWYRYIREGNTTYYDICGGSPSCDITSTR